jgi:beta-lactamase regulating signal transducer with metallopeptidase domain
MAGLIHGFEEAFRWILETTWQAAVLVGLILLAQWLLRKRLAPAWRYGLWLLVIVRLLMPVLPRSDFSIFNLARADQPDQVADNKPISTINNFDGTLNSDAGPAKESREDGLGPNTSASGMTTASRALLWFDWLKVSCLGWLAGVLFFASRLIWTNVRFRSRIKQHRPVANENVGRLFDGCRKEFKITRPVQMIESAEVESPGVYGIGRKWLLLPEGVFERFSREELRHTFLHELAHLKRRDLEVNWLAALLQILHWFNPAIWLAFARMRADRELATDALVLAHVSAMDNVAYGETIIKVAANLVRGGMRSGLVGIAESKAGLRERVRLIAGAGVARYWTWAAVGIVAILSCAGLTGAQATNTQKAAASSEDSNRVFNQTNGISGRVVDSHMHPINKAQVAIYKLTPRTFPDGSALPPLSSLNLRCAPMPQIFNPDYGHPMADLPQAREPWSFCTTDVKGRFYLNDLDRASGFLVVSESGFFWVPTNAFSTDLTIKLKPWGRITGTLWHYDNVVAHAPVQARFLVTRNDAFSWGPNCEFNTKTDERGRFSFDFVPPGYIGIDNAGFGERAIVKSGQTAGVKLGGSGRPVVGKVKIRSPDGKIEEADRFRYDLFTSFRDELKGKTKEELEAWSKRPISEKMALSFHNRPVQCAKDGSFRIDQVEPGKYELFVQTTGADAKHRSWLSGESEVEIPWSAGNTREPLDLGLIEISFNQPIPLDRSAK